MPAKYCLQDTGDLTAGYELPWSTGLRRLVEEIAKADFADVSSSRNAKSCGCMQLCISCSCQSCMSKPSTV